MNDKSLALMKAHNEKLDGFEAVEPYVLGVPNPIQKYKCYKGHEFEANRGSAAAGRVKCPFCKTSHKRLTHEQYEHKLLEMESSLYPIERYRGTTVKIKHKCINDHIVEIIPATVLKGGGCRTCSGLDPYTNETFDAKLISKGIKYIRVGNIYGIMYKTTFRCYLCNHEWQTKPHDILNGHGCPMCAKNGFNESKPAYLYYVKLSDEHKTYYKIGITNNSPERRLVVIPKTKKILMQQYFAKGQKALEEEQRIIKEFKQFLVSDKDFIKHGHTELFSKDILKLDE